MKTFSLFALLLVLGMGAASLLRTDHHGQLSNPNVSVAQTVDGAFRDGLYLGKLAAERGAESHIAIGRWATLEDRSSFAAGFQQGYHDFLASQAVSTTRGQRTE